ncbi:MAG: uracil-DNA glycosylase family protein [Acetobacteraceae bacterium]
MAQTNYPHGATSATSRGAEMLEAVAREARACTLCAPALPCPPRPVFRVSATARLLVIGQAPGARVQASGVPWDDPSGARLRGWLGLDAATFYDATRVAIVPMGFCYPGTLAGGGDAPPRPECAPLWHPRLFPLMPEIRLTLLVGSHAIAARLGRGPMAARVAAWRDRLPAMFPLPHPSWRTIGWERRNPWFTEEALPALRTLVEQAIST